jgi:PAS domain S-box-containing protein
MALAGAWLAMQLLSNGRIADQKKALTNALDYTVGALQGEAISSALGAAMLMGLNDAVLKSAAQGEVPADAPLVLEKLAVARSLFEADGAYVISAHGVIVAHATQGARSTGTNVAFRPYFKNAMKGDTNVYAAVGSVSDERGLYYAAPLHRDNHQTSAVIGVVMLKMPSSRIDQLLRFAGGDVMLLSPQGVVFASTQPQWLLHMTPPSSDKRLSEIKNLQQFGRRFAVNAPPVLPFDPLADMVDFKGQNHLTLRKNVEWNDQAGPWQLVSLHSTSVLVSPLERSLVGLFAFGILAAFGVLLLQVLVGRMRIAAGLARYNMVGTALEISPISVVITNAAGQIQWVNPQFELDSGYGLGELERRHVSLIWNSKDQTQEFALMVKSVLAGKAWRGELFNQRKDGSFFHGHTLIAPIFDAKKKVLGFVGLQEDTTQARLLQEELVQAKNRADAASRSKGSFLANMSHEIRTPMNAIIGMAYLIRQTGLSARQLDHIGKIEQSGQHLLAILDDILDISKVEAGKLTIERIPFELDNVTSNVANLVSGKATAKGLRLIWNVAPTVPHRMTGDPLRLGQILINYINNAVKFTTSGDIRIDVSVKENFGDEKLLGFDVTDNGIGISAEQAGRLFQSFEQADTSTTRQYGGSGLGLSISKGLAGLMGGSVGVESQLGHGSTFWFTARVGIVADVAQSDFAVLEASGLIVPPEVSSQHLFLAASALSGARILLAEDNEINQEVGSELLQMAGFVVDIAANGQIAVDKVAAMNNAATPYDLVLMDLQMPVMDGLRACSEIFSEPRNRELPVAAMTANVMHEDRLRCAAAGMTGFVIKPIDPDALWRVAVKMIRPRAGLGIKVTYSDGALAANLEAVQSQSGIPSGIAGLDAELGLRRVMGRETLYLALLRKFAASQAGVLGDLDLALDSGDWLLAERIAHTLKGVAGNIGARELEAAAAILEHGVRQGHLSHDHAMVKAALQRPKLLLDSLVAALEEKLPPTSSGFSELSASPAQVEVICQKLAALLANQDFEAEEVFAQNRTALRSALGTSYEELKRNIVSFNFDQALAELTNACAQRQITL